MGKLVKASLASVEFPLDEIDVYRTDRGGEFANREIDEMLQALGIRRSLSAKGCPCDNAVA